MTLIPDAWLVAPAQFVAEEPLRVQSAASVAERSLVERALARDETALAALYAQHAPAIHRFLRDLLSDPHAAADATQETFARAFRRLDTLRDTGRIAPWLFGIARNVSLEHNKARRRYSRVMAPECAVDGRDADRSSDGRTPENEMLGKEAARVLEAALEDLSEDRRAALLLRLDHGLPYEEIAKLMKWSLAKVKVEIFRARAALRNKLEKYEGGSR